MKPYYADDTVTLYGPGDCRNLLASVTAGSVDAVVTDPPYEYAFMGKTWDATGAAFDVVTWRRCLDVLKPGGWLFAFGGTRTYHRMVCAIEDAGFEIRDSLHWIYGSGFPKSLDVSKAAGATREVIGQGPYASRKPRPYEGGTALHISEQDTRVGHPITAPATDDARRWQGWGTALKPAHEPIVVARKPFPGTVAGNVLTHGTGALNIDACRTISAGPHGTRGNKKLEGFSETHRVYEGGLNNRKSPENPAGRWPTNVVLTHQPLLDDTGNIIGDACADGCVPGCPVADMDAQSGVTRSTGGEWRQRELTSRGYKGGGIGQRTSTDHEIVDGVTKPNYPGDGGASRFFPVFRYEAKAPASERPRGTDGTAHATVKPLSLMRWLTRLVTQPSGIVCDPFLGSGTTAEACVIEGFRCIGIELDAAHLQLVTARLSKPIQPTLGEPA